MSSLSRDGRGRVRLLGLFGVFLFMVLATRLAWLQIVEHESHETRAKNQQMERVRTLPRRGRILDRNMTPLAYSVENPIVIAEPRKLADPAVRRKVAETLAPLLDMKVSDLDARMKKKAPTIVLNRKPTAVPIDSLKARTRSLPGIRVDSEFKRVYPLGAAAGHVTGFVGVDQEGIEGTERAFDSMLQGTPGWVTLRRDARGGRHSFGYEKKPVPGHDLVLTIDAYLQEVTANRLAEAVKTCNAKAGWAIVVDPQSGDVLAMANCPTYDPTWYDTAPKEAYRNHILSDRIEPGSTFKAMTTAMALEENVMRPETPIDCKGGQWVLYGKPITDHEGMGTVPFIDTFVHSSNIAMAQVGLKLGPDRMYHYLKKFGFGQKAGLGLPGEEAGFLKKTDKWSARTPATIAFGYEIQVTALQLAMAYAALANDGILMKPRFVKEVRLDDGSVLQASSPEQVRRVVTTKTADRLLEFMAKTVADGTGKAAALDWCVVGGKTGTARKYDAASGGYVKKHYASFIGVAPIDDPRLLCYVVIDEPKGNIYGGSTAAPAFKEIIEAAGKSPHPLLRPDFEVVAARPVPSGVSRILSRMSSAFAVDAAWAAAETAAAHADTNWIGSDATGDDAMAERGPSGPVAPDFIGLTMRVALRRAEEAHVGLKMTEDLGVVVRQFPAPGQRTEAENPQVTIFFGNREELEGKDED